RIVSWSHDAGLMGVVHSLGLWHGVLAFGFGLVLGMTFDTVPAVEPAVAPAAEPVAERRMRRGRRAAAAAPADRYAADEPVTAEQQAVPADDGAAPANRGRVRLGGRGPAGRTAEAV